MLRLESVTKHFGEVTAVDDVSLHVERGELLTLLGPSGCGKTTTLRMIAGFEPVTSGRIFLDERDITELPPQKRGAGMVFQSYALFPHLDVFENVAFGLKARGTARSDITRRVERALELVDLGGYARRRVQQLSGGQQQRVALARALAPEPPVLLLDEPLSNLDAALRERTREELRAVLGRIGITSVFVTHDQEEAFALSDRIALMNAGRVEQVGPPERLYADPATPFAAAFVGRASFLPARVATVEGELLQCEVAPSVRWRARPAPGLALSPAAAQASGVATAPAYPPGTGPSVRLMLRPEWLGFAPEGATGAVTAEVLDRRFAGSATFYRVRIAAGPSGTAVASGRAGDADAGQGPELLVQSTAGAAAPGEVVHLVPRETARAFPPEET